MNTRDVGNVTCLKVMARFLEKGYNVLTPFGDNTKYDFVAEKDGKFLRVQCKTARKVKLNNSITFNLYVVASNYLGSRKKYYTKEDIDLFATVWEDKVCILPIENIGERKTFTLSLNSKKEAKQIKNVNFLEDYIF